MKKILLGLFLLVPAVLSAQISFGITAGANIGKFGGVEPRDASYASRTGLNFGAVVGYRFSKDISLTLQPTFSQRGSDIEVGEDTFFDSLQVYEAKINFLAIPVFLRVDADNGVVYFISGIEIGIPLRAEFVHNDVSKDITDWLNNVDLLASIGMGFRFSMGRPDLMIEFRYYQGLTNFNARDGEDGGHILFENFKNSGFQIMAGFEWEL